MSPLDKTYALSVREAPKSVNASGGGSRANPYVAAREKKRWEGLWLQQFMVARMDPFMSFAKVTFNVYFKQRHHRDTENYRHPVVKPFADALVKGGYLKDDTDEWFRVEDFRVLEGPDWWPLYRMPPLVTALTDVVLEATYE